MYSCIIMYIKKAFWYIIVHSKLSKINDCILVIFTFLAVLYKSKDIILQFFTNISPSLLSLFIDDGA